MPHDLTAAPNCTIRLIHYPPHPDPEDNEFGFAEPLGEIIRGQIQRRTPTTIS
jgi:hypothetical protein